MRSLRWVEAMLGFMVLGVILEMLTILHLHLSLVKAVNQLMVCEQGGGIECHIERDGLDYNVYSY